SLLLAGGAGTRLSGDAPKGVRPLAGRPLYAHSLAVFEADSRVEDHVVVAPAAWLDLVREHLSGAEPQGAAGSGSRGGSRGPGGGSRKPVVVVAGGPRRQDSVLAGLQAIAERAGSRGRGPAGLVAVHDAA